MRFKEQLYYYYYFNILILIQFLLSTHFMTIIRYRFLPMLSFMLPSKHKNQRGSLLLWSGLPRVSVTLAKFPCTQGSQLTYTQQIALLKVSFFQLFDRSKISSFLTVKFQFYCKVIFLSNYYLIMVVMNWNILSYGC